MTIQLDHVIVPSHHQRQFGEAPGRPPGGGLGGVARRVHAGLRQRVADPRLRRTRPVPALPSVLPRQRRRLRRDLRADPVRRPGVPEPAARRERHADQPSARWQERLLGRPSAMLARSLLRPRSPVSVWGGTPVARWGARECDHRSQRVDVRGSRRSRRASPTRLRARTMTKIARPGSRTTWGLRTTN